MEFWKSILKVTFDPGGAAELVLLDWGDEMSLLPVLPWRQQVDSPPYTGADYAGNIARGAIAREWTLSRVVSYASHHALQAAIFTTDAAWPVQLTKSLQVEILQVGTTATVHDTRTTTASLERVDPTPVPYKDAVDYRMVLRVGLFEVPAP